jgi:hypothetical protein
MLDEKLELALLRKPMPASASQSRGLGPYPHEHYGHELYRCHPYRNDAQDAYVMDPDHADEGQSKNASVPDGLVRDSDSGFTSAEVVYGVTGTEVTVLPEYGVSP